jgi:hypothetical protein
MDDIMEDRPLQILLRVSKQNLSKKNKITCKITTLIGNLLNTSRINHPRLEKNID